MNREEIELQPVWDAFMGGGGATILVFYKFMCWFRKWRMFFIGCIIGNKVYDSYFDDGISWRINGYGMRTDA